MDTGRAAIELAIVVEQMTVAPYYLPDEKEPRLKRAQKWCLDGKVHDKGDGTYIVDGSKPGTFYLLTDTHCTCEHATKGKSRWCYHACAVKLYQEWQRRITPLGATQQMPLSGMPKTVDERLAAASDVPLDTAHPSPVIAHPAHHGPEAPMDTPSTHDFPEPTLTTDAPRVVQEDRAPVLQPVTADMSEPHPHSGASLMIRSTQVGQLIHALVQAQERIRNPKFDATNPHFRMKYASLAAVRDAVVPALAQYGLTVTQFPGTEDGCVSCETILWHTSGQYLGSLLTLPVSKQDAQGYGAALTYARRYGLMTLCNVVGDEDDDAESVVRQEEKSLPGVSAREQVVKLLKQLGFAGTTREAYEQEVQRRTGMALHPDNYTAIVGKLTQQVAQQAA